MWFIKLLLWLQVFASPALLFAIIAFVIYSKNENNKSIAIILLIIGGILGAFFAEWVRRKYGLENFFGQLYGSGRKDDDTRNSN
jgi:uncharacterized membrane protein YeaQ/YmgE (transglycosylase-associated protein family)